MTGLTEYWLEFPRILSKKPMKTRGENKKPINKAYVKGSL